MLTTFSYFGGYGSSYLGSAPSKCQPLELGTGIHSYVIGDDAQAIGTTPGRPVGLG